jgi:hypothetical protein
VATVEPPSTSVAPLEGGQLPHINTEVQQGRRHGFKFEGANIFGAKRRKKFFACHLKILLAPSNFIHVSPKFALQNV